MTKKLLALLLALVLCVGVFAACGNNNNDDTGSGSTIQGGLVNGVYVTPNFNGGKITMYMPNNSDIDPSKTWLNDTVEAHLNLTLDIIEGADLTGMLAKGEVPDLQWTNTYSSLGMQQNGRQDKIYINIYDYLDQMPNLKKVLEDPANAHYVQKYSLAEGEMYNVPVIKQGGDTSTKYAFLYRKDVFDKNNLKFPTNQTEFVATLEKLKELYPDSYPFVMRQMTGNMQGAQAFGHLWGGVHLLRGEYSSVFTLDADGKYYLATSSQAYKEMAMFMKEMTDKGLMHKSSLTLDYGGWVATFSGNESFITYDKVDRLPAINNALVSVNAEYLMTAADPFNFGTHATTGAKVSVSFAETGPQYSFCIGNGKNVQAVIKYVDWLYSEEGQIMTNWGVKDVSYVESAEGVKSFKEGFLDSKGGLVQSGLYAASMSGVLDFEAYKGSCDANMVASLEIAAKYEGGTPAQVPLVFSEKDNLTWGTVAKSFETYTRAELTKFISGQRDFSTWDNVIQELKDNYKYDWLMDLHVNSLAERQQALGKK